MAVTNNCCDIFQKNLDNLLVLPEKTSEDDQRLHYTVAMNAYPNII